MSDQFILDEQRRIVARLVGLAFDESSNAYTGHVEFVNVPKGLLSALEELESKVDTQQLGAAETIQQTVNAFNLSFSDESNVFRPICDLFVNRDKEVSFRLRPAVYPWLKRISDSST